MSEKRPEGEYSERLRAKLAGLPNRPGCYRHLSRAGEVLYVGKAASLRSRVRSYFQPSAKHAPRIAAMVREVHDIDIIVTESEIEALILENNLIKEQRPRYNVLLRDDKTFPYLKLTEKDEFPRVVLVRKPREDGSRYYGPFIPTSHARRTLRMIPRFFQVANCHLPFDGKQRPCLYYHIDQCMAPCAGRADRALYADQVEQARLFLEGRDGDLRKLLAQRMEEASASLDFEAAARYRDMLRTLASLADRQQMVSARLGDVDFWAEYREGEQAAVELFRMREGRVIGRREFTLDPAGDPGVFYDEILPQYYASEEPASEIVLPRLPRDVEMIRLYLRERRGAAVAIKAPSRGERRRFLDLVAKNARFAFEARFRAQHVHGVAVLEDLRDILGLDAAPYRIEGFDISHIQGEETRASMVCFEGGKAQRSGYRSYKIRTADAGDDYQAMREAVSRRYGRLKREDRRLPDLILIDGGKGQLAAAREALRELDLAAIPTISLAKREEEIFLEGASKPILLGRDDPALHLVQQIRDEAHRFALKHHRKARSKRRLGSRLTEIPGIGPTTARRLLEQFGSLAGVQAASAEALAAAIGPARAAVLRRGLAQWERGLGSEQESGR